MSEEKKARLRKLYALEHLTSKEDPSEDEKNEIKEIRDELMISNTVCKPEKTFVLEEYIELLKKMPHASDMERAKVMGISKNQLFRGKRKYKLNKKGA